MNFLEALRVIHEYPDLWAVREDEAAPERALAWDEMKRYYIWVPNPSGRTLPAAIPSFEIVSAEWEVISPDEFYDRQQGGDHG